MNNRELKFRIWCKGTSTNVNFNKPRWIQPTDFILLKYYRCFQDVIESDDFVVQQYTGLKDRDGKDIYEGDIIEHTFSKTTDDETSIHFGSKLNGSVSFCNHLCAYILTIISDDRHNGDTFQLMNHAPSKKIIGNVFENPELIKTNE